MPEGDPLPPLPSGCFALEPLESAARPLVQAIREFRPHVMLTYDENGGYPHPDHIKTHRVAIGAFFYAADIERFPGGEPFRPSKLYYSAFPKSVLRQMAEAMQRAGVENRFSTDGEPPPFAVSDDRVTTWLDVSQYIDKKLGAMRAHRTQIPEDSWFLKLNEALGPKAGVVIDCRGFAARPHLPQLRGVRGEMIRVRTRSRSLSTMYWTAWLATIFVMKGNKHHA